MQRINALAAAVLLSAFVVAPLQAHALLERSDPPVGATLKTAPRQIELFFSEALEPAASSIKVFNEAGTEIDKGEVHADVKKKSSLTVSLPKLRLGRCKVVWRAVSVDGHVTTGSFAFQVAH